MNKDIIFSEVEYTKLKEHLITPLHWIEIFTSKIQICIEVRQHYCDRGKFLVRADTINFLPGDDMIDHQDGFPRYYYDFDCMMVEITKFIRAKKESEIKKILFRDIFEMEKEIKQKKEKDSITIEFNKAIAWAKI